MIKKEQQKNFNEATFNSRNILKTLEMLDRL